MKWGEAMNDRQYKVEQLMEYGKSLLSTKITSLVPRFPHYYVLTFANAHWAALFICDQNYYVDVKYGDGGAKQRDRSPFCKPFYMRSQEWVGLDLSCHLVALKKAMKDCFARHNDQDDILILDDDLPLSSESVAIPSRRSQERRQTRSFSKPTIQPQRKPVSSPQPQQTIHKEEKKKKSVVKEIKDVLNMKAKGYHVAEVNYAQGIMLSKLDDDYEIVPLGQNIRAYGDMRVEQVRSYLTLRKQFRNHKYPKIPGNYDLIYAQEIINNIGISSYEEGLKSLEELEHAYHHGNIREWIDDYALIYELDEGVPSENDMEALDVHTNHSIEKFINSLKDLNLYKGHCALAKKKKNYHELLYFVFDKLEREGFYKKFILDNTGEERPLFRGALYYPDALPLFFFDRTVGDTHYRFNIQTKMLRTNKRSLKDEKAMQEFMETLDLIIEHFYNDQPLHEDDLQKYFYRRAYEIVGIYKTMKIYYKSQTHVYVSRVRVEMQKKQSFVDMANTLKDVNLPYHYYYITHPKSKLYYEEFNDEDLFYYLYLRTRQREKEDDEILDTPYQENYIREVMCGIGFKNLDEAFLELLHIDEFFDHNYAFYLKLFLFVHHMKRDHPEYFKEEKRYRTIAKFIDPETSDEQFFKACQEISNYDFKKSRPYKDDPERFIHIVHEVIKKLIDQKELNIVEDYIYYDDLTSVYDEDAHLEDFGLKEDEVISIGPLHYFYYDSDHIRWRIHSPALCSNRRRFFKEIDCVIREVYSSGRLIQDSLDDREIIEAIRKAVLEENAEHEHAEREKRKVKINFTSLSKIREDADYITEQVATSEEKAIMDEHLASQIVEQTDEPKDDVLFTDDEKEVLKRFVSHQNVDAYINEKHLLISVIVDAINEKFLDLVGDQVIDFDGETYSFVDDYKEDVEAYLVHDPIQDQDPAPLQKAAEQNTFGLSDDEMSILKLLVKHQDISAYVKEHHFLESVLVDAINEKFYDVVGDQIIDFDGETYSFVDDYKEDVEDYLGGEQTKDQPKQNALGLSDDEMTILELFMKHQKTDPYVKDHHLLESVLVDAINEKFYDEIGDQIIDFDGETYSFVDDYLEDVQEILNS